MGVNMLIEYAVGKTGDESFGGNKPSCEVVVDGTTCR